MKKLWIEIQNGDKLLFSRQYELESIEYNCYFVRMVTKAVLVDLRSSGRVMVSLLRRCLIKLIRIIANSKDMKDEQSATMTKDQLKIIAKIINDTRY